jgi:hypothetical protein
VRSPRHVIRLLLLCAVLFSVQNSYAQAVNDYQSTVPGGSWNTLATWNQWNGSAWVAAAATPTSASQVINIPMGSTVTVTASVAVDELTVDGTLNTSGAAVLTVANGAGVDLTINGTFGDNSSGSIVFTGTWQMGASGTLIKTTGSGSNAWQSGYQGGIANIPATSNWIIRRTATAVPMSSTTPASGAVYPNLTIENNGAAVYVPVAAQSFTGSAINITVKGNLDIGGAGTGVVEFWNNNTHANPTIVMGNMMIRSGSTWKNYGTGVEVRGDLTVNGTFCYDGNDGRKLIMGGGNNQTISGTGFLNIYDFTLNKSGGSVTLSRTVVVDNLCTFTNGVVNTSAGNLLIIGKYGAVAGANNTSYVDGPVRYYGSGAFTFPVGESGDYQSIAISGFTPAAPLYSENFNNGCASLCLASAHPGWTVTSTGTNDAKANQFFVSCTENGNAIGACGSACTGDQTLHIGNVATSPLAALFCSTGDCGAAYDAGLGTNAVRTSKRAETPAINCTGSSNIGLTFRYMYSGGAANLNDNATVWYFDGSSWSLLQPLNKSSTGCAPQGTWTGCCVALPASANNNANVKIGFQWVNNDDGAGGDPSFAVDEVQVGVMECYTAEYFHANPQSPYGAALAPTLQYLSSCEYWILDRTAGTSTQTSVTLAWDANSCPVWTVSDLRVARYDGISTWQDEGSASTTGTTVAGTITSNLVTSFSPFTLAAITTNPLPVVLTTFDAWYDSRSSQLEWITSSEINNDYFIIERANESGEYIPLGRVDGHGTTSQPNHYHFTDTDPYVGANYYRLKQVDYNGQSEYSPVRIVTTEETTALDILSVNTISNQIDVSVVAPEGMNVQAQITDVSGRIVYAEGTVIHHQPTHFVTSQLTSGIYFIEVSDGKKRIIRKVQLLNE